MIPMTRGRRHLAAKTSIHEPLASCSFSASISARSASMSAPGSTLSRAARAASWRPIFTYHRGESGRGRTARTKSTAGTAEIPSMTRHWLPLINR